MATTPTTTATTKLKVLTRIYDPFVGRTESGYNGFLIEIWERIARKLRYDDIIMLAIIFLCNVQ